MKRASVSNITARFRAYLKAAEDGPVVVTKKGKAVAVLLSVADDDEVERLILAHSPKFQKILNRGKQQIRETGGIKHDDFWQQVEAEAQIRG
jgi:prevent-host-death family protein